ncbi:MAG: phosphate acyltransferase [Planctomycetota bacterium]|nr:phosphate acyltransferase [Planctomycetota bacterium]
MSRLRKAAISGRPKTLAVVEAADAEVLKAVSEAADLGIASSLLLGRYEQIRTVADELRIVLDKFEVIETVSAEDSVKKAAKAINDGRASMLMKGHLPTADIMKGVLDKENNLRGGGKLSHTMVAQADKFGRFLLLSDAGLNPDPDEDLLAAIIDNSVELAHVLGVEKPKVAVLSAIEKETDKIPSTVLAAKMKARFADSSDRAVDGPIALDLALSSFAADVKGYKNRSVAGAADVLIVPEIVSGNVLGKSFIHCADFRCGGLITGARIPIVLLSRSDTSEVKLDSIALASVYAQSNIPQD